MKESIGLGRACSHEAPLVLVGVFIGSATTIWFQTITSSVIADIGDEQELLTHERQEGVFFAAQGFSIKFVTGIGSFLGGPVLKFVDLPVGIAPGEVTPDVLFRLGVVMGQLLTLFMVVPFLLARKITLSKDRHEEFRIALEARYAAAATKNESDSCPFGRPTDPCHYASYFYSSLRRFWQ